MIFVKITRFTPVISKKCLGHFSVARLVILWYAQELLSLGSMAFLFKRILFFFYKAHLSKRCSARLCGNGQDKLTVLE